MYLIQLGLLYLLDLHVHVFVGCTLKDNAFQISQPDEILPFNDFRFQLPVCLPV